MFVTKMKTTELTRYEMVIESFARRALDSTCSISEWGTADHQSLRTHLCPVRERKVSSRFSSSEHCRRLESEALISYAGNDMIEDEVLRALVEEPDETYSQDLTMKDHDDQIESPFEISG